jgi:hypothetical protein
VPVYNSALLPGFSQKRKNTGQFWPISSSRSLISDLNRLRYTVNCQSIQLPEVNMRVRNWLSCDVVRCFSIYTVLGPEHVYYSGKVTFLLLQLEDVAIAT